MKMWMQFNVMPRTRDTDSNYLPVQMISSRCAGNSFHTLEPSCWQHLNNCCHAFETIMTSFSVLRPRQGRLRRSSSVERRQRGGNMKSIYRTRASLANSDQIISFSLIITTMGTYGANLTRLNCVTSESHRRSYSTDSNCPKLHRKS